jgi:hypothetical protein
MYLIADGVAHVSFRGGALFLPVHSPDDRQALMEHVAARVRSEGCVQVLLGGTRWIVQALGGQSVPCQYCGSMGPSLPRATADDGAPMCLACAFSKRREPARPRHQLLPAVEPAALGGAACRPHSPQTEPYRRGSGHSGAEP